MHNKITAYKEEFKFNFDDKEVSEESLFIASLYMLSYDLSMNPKVYKIEKEHSLWIYYEKSCYVVENFFNEFGISFGVISNKYPVSIYGTINDNESASLVSVYDIGEGKISLFKKNISGNDFDEMSDICVKIEISDVSLLNNFFKLISDLDYRKSFLAVERAKFKDLTFKGIDEEGEDTYFRYLKLNEPYDGEMFIDALTINQMKKLWQIFLEEKISALEFDYALGGYQQDSLYSLFEWELALRLVLSDMDISIKYDDNSFNVLDKNNKRLYFDYNSENSAEKLFLKILFPIKNTF